MSDDQFKEEARKCLTIWEHIIIIIAVTNQKVKFSWCNYYCVKSGPICLYIDIFHANSTQSDETLQTSYALKTTNPLGETWIIVAYESWLYVWCRAHKCLRFNIFSEKNHKSWKHFFRKKPFILNHMTDNSHHENQQLDFWIFISILLIHRSRLEESCL